MPSNRKKNILDKIDRPLKLCSCGIGETKANSAQTALEVLFGILILTLVIGFLIFSGAPVVIVVAMSALLAPITILLSFSRFFSTKHSLMCSFRWSLIKLFGVARWF